MMRRSSASARVGFCRGAALRSLAVVCSIALGAVNGSAAAQQPRDSFLFETTAWEPYTPAYLGSGLLGVTSTRLGTDPAPSYLAGVYDHGPRDVPRLALLPAWNAIDVHDGTTWLNAGSAVDGYRQSLDMHEAILRSDYEWGAPDHRMKVSVSTFVSRALPTLGVVRLAITPKYSGPTKVRMDLSDWPKPTRNPFATLTTLEPKLRNRESVWYPGEVASVPSSVRMEKRGAVLQMTSTPLGSAKKVAVVAALQWPAGLKDVKVHTTATPQRDAGDKVRAQTTVEVSFEGAAGETYVFDKFVALSGPGSAAATTVDAGRIARNARARGFASIVDEHRAAWRTLWNSDIEIEGDPELQRAVHAALFYLLESAPPKGRLSIPPMGLSNAGYFGHVFWDADSFMFPVLLALHPDLAKQLVAFRSKTLPAAKANARANGFQGAMYPWEAGPDGVETTPFFAHQNATSEIHVNASVALAQWQYFQATGDRTWLSRDGYPIIRDTADFWVSRVTWKADRGRYEILNVVSVDEAKIGVDNDPYTNASAKKNLQLANEAARLLDETPNPKWSEIADKLFLPPADSVLIDYPLEMPLPDDEKRGLLKSALEQAGGRQSGVMMEWGFYPVLAVNLREKAALRLLMEKGYKGHLRPPFLAISETPTNDNINFLTGAGAFLHQFLFGYSGLRFSSDGGLIQKMEPLLPAGVTRMTLRNVWIRGAPRDVVISDQ